MFVITGDSGTGLTHTTIGAKIVTDLIMNRYLLRLSLFCLEPFALLSLLLIIFNRENEYAELYRPSRKPALRAVPGGMKAAFEMSSGYLKYSPTFPLIYNSYSYFLIHYLIITLFILILIFILSFCSWVKTGDISDIEDLRPNTGGVLIKHRKPIACYKYTLLSLSLPPLSPLFSSPFLSYHSFRDENGKVTQCSAVCTHLSGIVNWNDAEKSWDCPCHGSRFDKYGKCIQGPAIKVQ